MTNKISTYIEKRKLDLSALLHEEADYQNIVSFHQETIEGLLDLVREILENARFDITPIEESIEAGMTISEAHNVHSNAYGYNNALVDILNELPSKK